MHQHVSRLEVEHIVLGLDARGRLAQLRAQQRRGVCRRGRRAGLLGKAEGAAHAARDPPLAPLLGLLLDGCGREQPTEAPDNEALLGLVLPCERGVERHPRADLGKRVGGGHLSPCVTEAATPCKTGCNS
eukprot:scaffold22244_cov62-Phaeocystis_antarctica.AAC.3